jgi:hypothetical protein
VEFDDNKTDHPTVFECDPGIGVISGAGCLDCFALALTPIGMEMLVDLGIHGLLD